MKPRVLVIFDVPPPATLDRDFRRELRAAGWETERDVLGALRALGLSHAALGVYDDLGLLRRKLAQFQPDVVLNLLERFRDDAARERQVAAYLESRGVPFTGCGSAGLALCKDKARSKQRLRRQGIRVPAFVRLPVGKPVVRPTGLAFPLFVKPLREEASYGIARASYVVDDAALRARVAFIHRTFRQEAIAEEYIAGRELYVSVLGNGAAWEVFPTRELVFGNVPARTPQFASYQAKWSAAYRRRWGIRSRFAPGLTPATQARIAASTRRCCRLLRIRGYARLDWRLSPGGDLVFLEANPNPILSRDEDFARSAARAGLAYPDLIARILGLAIPEWFSPAVVLPYETPQP